MEVKLKVMYKEIFFLILISFLSCPSNQKVITDSCQLNELKLQLIQEGNTCALEFSPRRYLIEGDISLNPPCYFVRENGVVQSFSYPEVGVDKVLVIIGDISSDENKERFDVPKKEVCGDKIQGVLVQGNRIILTEKTLSGGITCKDFGLDEKNFWDFAH